jgi:hypothetical protein
VLSTMMALLRNSRKVPPVLSDKRSLSLVDKHLIKLAFFLFGCILCQVVEQLGVVMDGSSVLPQVHELLMLG